MTCCCLILIIFLTACGSIRKGIAASDRSIVILYDNDVHCVIEGYAALAGLRDAIKAADTAYVATVSSGDYVQGATVGTLSTGGYVIDIMNSVGYEAVTLGNHEFDYKSTRLFELAHQLDAPIVCVNLTPANTDHRCFNPYIIRQYGHRKVAFIGVTTPYSMRGERAAFFDGDRQLYDLHEKDFVALTQQAVNEARREGADYVVVLSHIGEADEDYLSVDLIAATTGIDVVLDGHTHAAIPQMWVNNKAGEKVLLSQTGSKFTHVGKLTIAPNGTIATELLPVKEIPYSSARVKQVTDSICGLMDEVINKVIGESEVALTALDEEEMWLVRHEETNCADFVTDAYRTVLGADIALCNGGGIRANLAAGAVRYTDLINLNPFGNQMYLIEVRGGDLLAALNQGISSLPQNSGSFPLVSGMRYKVKVSPAGNYVESAEVADAKGDYHALDPEKSYRVACTEYVFKTEFDGKLSSSSVIRNQVMSDYEALLNYFTQYLHGHIGQHYAEKEKRIDIQYAE